MLSSLSRFLLTAALISPAAAFAAPTQESLAREYDQVRKIAMRDPKVQAAYAAADQRLEEKILKIDPALTAYVKSRGRAPSGSGAEKPAPARTAPAAAKKPAAPARRDSTHVVASGDTLSSIAAKHRITVAALRKANHIQDERKLPIGQTLTIPAASTSR
jgi:peptidoglycan endopeptidase LytE